MADLKDLSLAHHKAGHGVTALLLNVRMGSRAISIVPKAAYRWKPRASRVYLSDCEKFMWSPATVRLIENKIIVCLAGMAAQRRYSTSLVRPQNGGSDRRQAVDLLRPLTSSQRELKAYLTLLHVRAEQLMASEAVWQAIGTVAYALVERRQLSGKQIDTLIHSAST